MIDEVGILVDVISDSDGLIWTFILWSVILSIYFIIDSDIDILSALILSPAVVISAVLMISVVIIGITSLLPVLAGFFVLIFLFVYIPLSI